MVNGALSDFFHYYYLSISRLNPGTPSFSYFYKWYAFFKQIVKYKLYWWYYGSMQEEKHWWVMVAFVNTELQKIGIWLWSIKLAINASKTKIMIFHPEGKIIPEAWFFFNNNDFDVFVDPELIYLSRKFITILSPVLHIKFLVFMLMKSSLLIIILKLL